MNIFYLDHNIERSVQFHCDQHVVKMVTETAQMMSAAHHLCGDTEDPRLMRKTHVNHPCTKWIRESTGNYRWAIDFYNALSNEYTWRYGKIHASFSKRYEILHKIPVNIPDGPFTEPPKCVPDEFKVGSLVDTYRNFYIKDKSKFARWRYTPKPWWIVNVEYDK